MKVYILIPGNVYDLFNEDDFNWFKYDLTKKLRQIFDELQIYLIRKSSIRSFEVYFMQKQVSDYTDSQVIGYVIKILKEKFGSKVGSNPLVKINYSAFNPNFCPVSEKRADDSNNMSKSNADISEFDYERLSLNYHAVDPRYSFDQVVLPQKVREKIEEAIGIIEVESKVFDEWGLRSIVPVAASALSFYGPPGTGKSMAAEAVAHKLGKKILSATYADIESKYHGEGPKMVKAIFKAAERDDAVLFLDESDSLLSKRLTNVSDGSAQAINSMRSQLLISLEQFKGIVIFATNLVVNYDKAFLSRLINIEFTYPNVDEREKIWWNHLKSEHIHIPLYDDVNIRNLAKEYEFCGREIKNSIKNACVSVALEKREEVTQSDFIKACKRTLEEREKVISASDHTSINNDSIRGELQKRILD